VYSSEVCNSLGYCYYYVDVTTLPGRVQMFSKTGRGVVLDSYDRVIKSGDPRSAKTFLMVQCRAWDNVSAELRTRCVSFMDVDRSDMYVRIRGYNLYVDPEYDMSEVPANFELDSSFILHADAFYYGYYALESLRYRGRHTTIHPSHGYLYVSPEIYSTDFRDAASFKLYEYDTSGKYRRCFGGVSGLNK